MNTFLATILQKHFCTIGHDGLGTQKACKIDRMGSGLSEKNNNTFKKHNLLTLLTLFVTIIHQIEGYETSTQPIKALETTIWCY